MYINHTNDKTQCDLCNNNIEDLEDKTLIRVCKECKPKLKKHFERRQELNDAEE